MAGTEYLTTGDVARHFKRPVWVVRKLFERRILPEARRIGGYRVVSRADLPAIEQAMRDAGYLPGTTNPAPAR